MKKKRNIIKQGQYYIQWVIATLMLLVYVVGTLVSYNKTMKSIIETRTLDRVSKQAIMIRGFYEGKFSGAIDTATAIADFASGQEDITDDSVINILNSLILDSELKKAYIVRTDGSAVDNLGIEYKTLDNSQNYTELLEGKRILCPIRDINGVTTVFIGVPITRGSKLLGHIIFSYVPSSMKKIINSPLYSYSLVFDDGYVVENIGNYPICKEGENLIENLKDTPFTSGSYSIFSQGITGNRSANAMVTGRDGASYYLVSQPINNMNSAIVVTSSEAQILRSSREDNEVTENMIMKLIVSLIIFIALLMGIYFINRIAFSKTSKELQDKAETDLLTGLLNKVSTENKIKEYISEEGKSNTSMMCVLDIDNFKKINDTMGHAFGDEVLAALGKQIGSEFRVTDIIGRTGGDEFIIFLKDLKDDEIISREANRVATFFKNFTVGDYTKYAATASIGVALYPRDGEDFEALYKAADTALYKAKNRGKNQMAFYKEN